MRFWKFSLRFFLNEIREFEVLFWSIIFPLVLYFFLNAILGGTGPNASTEAFKLGVVREELANPGHQLVDRSLEQICGKDKPFSRKDMYDREEGMRELKDNKVDLILLIPSGTADATNRTLTTGQGSVPLEIYHVSGRESSRVAMNVLSAAFDQANLEINKAMNPYFIPVSSEEVPVSGNSRGVSYKDYIFPAIALMMMLSVGLFNSPQGLIFYRTSGTNRKLFTTPLRPWEYFGAHLGKLFLTMLIALGLLYAFAYFVYDVRVGIFSLGFFGFLLLSMAVLTSFGLMLASIATKESVAIVLGQSSYQLMMFLGGFYFPVLTLPWSMRWLVHALPTTYLVELGRRSMGIASAELPLYLLLGVPAAWLLFSTLVFSLNYRKVMGYE